MMRFFEALKFDAVTIGNHEFDAGVFGFLRFMDNIEARQKQKRIEAVRDRVDPTPSVPIVVSN